MFSYSKVASLVPLHLHTISAATMPDPDIEVATPSTNSAPGFPVPTITKFLEHAGEPSGDFREWIQDFENVIMLNDMNRPAGRELSEHQKNRFLLSMLGKEGARKFRADRIGKSPEAFKFVDYVKAATNLFQPKASEYKCYYDFFTRQQGAQESAEEFITGLKKLAGECDFKDLEDKMVAIRLVTGCNDVETKTKLLQHKKINLEDAENELLSVEAVRAEVHSMDSKSTTIKAVQKKFPSRGRERQKWQESKPRKDAKGNDTKGSNPRQECSACGYTGHRTGDPKCPAIGSECRACGRRNHFEKVCRSKKPATSTQRKVSEDDPRIYRVFGKRRTGRIMMTAEVSDNTKFVDTLMQVDTAAETSCLRESVFRKSFSHLPLVKCAPTLRNYDGTEIKGVKGWFMTKVRWRGKVHRDRMFVVPNDRDTIIGFNFLGPLGIWINCQGETVHAVHDSPRYTSPSEIRAKYPNLFAEKLGTFPGYKHEIRVKPGASPKIARLRPVPLARREAVDKEIAEMERQGIWEKVTRSEWVHPMVSVPKKNGGIRITTDLSPLNPDIVPEQFPIPSIKDILLEMRGAKVFSKLDLRKGYFHIVLDEKSRCFTTTITPRGLFQYQRLPMGLKESASVFQRLVDQTLSDCPGCERYIDDILIFGKTQEEHDANLDRVLRRLDRKDFRLADEEKLEIGVSEVPALGHVISAEGITPDQKNIKPILEFAEPKTKKEVMAFLGMINFYGDFIPDIASLAEPLRRLTRKGEQFKWTDTCRASFETLKGMAASKLKVYLFDPNAQTTVTTDASDVGLGAVLSQKQGKEEVPIAFAARTLSGAERNYSASEREALGCVWACEKWEKYLLGIPFTLKTDHAALETLLRSHGNLRQSSKFSRWLERLSAFDYTPLYLKGTENKVADALSRLVEKAKEVGVEPPELDEGGRIQGIKYDEMKCESRSDPLFRDIKKYLQSGWPNKGRRDRVLQAFYKLRNELRIKDDGCLIRHGGQIVTPAAMQQGILQAAHEGHPGIVRFKRELRKTYWWPGMSTQAEEVVKHCVPCQRSAKSTVGSEIGEKIIPAPEAAGEQYAIDITGPFFNDQYVVVLIDYYSRFPEIFTTNITTSVKIINWLEGHFARYGNPNGLVSDNGPQFVSREFKEFLREKDIHHYRAAVYNPQENGLVESFNKYLKHGVQAFHAAGKSWDRGLRDLLIQFRATEAGPGKQSPAKLFLGRDIRTDWMPNTSPPLRHVEPTGKKEDDRPSPPKTLRRGKYRVGDMVMTRLPHSRKGTSPFSAPKRVTEVLGYFTFRLEDGQKWNARRLKLLRPPMEVAAWIPHNGSGTDTEDVEGQRGRAPTPPRRRTTRSTAGKKPKNFSPSPPRSKKLKGVMVCPSPSI